MDRDEEMTLPPEEMDGEQQESISGPAAEAPAAPDTNIPSGKYDRLLNENSRKYKLSGMFREWFLDYSSYVILQRAVPDMTDGLKPVQRRILHALYRIDDGAPIKVATIIGEAMKFHPHGDASIEGALVQLGQKNMLIDCQGNWGNILTGDSNAAPRYIEAKLSRLAKEILFNPKTTEWMNSYDGRNQEPVELPVKFPLLLAQGAEGIAVGLASKILPHNFNELIDASIAILQDKPFELYPDFPTGGFADCSRYNRGRRGGTVKVRAKIEKIDKNTIAITEIPFGKTTGLLIESILKAKDKGKIKIKKIDDLTTDRAEIVIHLPNDVSPDKTIDALYAFTDCEISISPNACVIADNKPQFLDVHEILRYNTKHTMDLLGRELRIRLDELAEEWHYSSLEKIFFENQVYKILEDRSFSTWDAQLAEVFSRMKEYQALVQKEIVMDDIDRLVEKPVRKISKFDAKAMDEKLRSLEEEMDEISNHLAHLPEFTAAYLRNLKKKYGKAYPRQTEIVNFESIEATRVVNNNAKLYANMTEGFVGINLKKEDNAEYICDCSDLSEIIVFHKDGKYMVTKVSNKAFLGKDIIHVGVFDRNDTRTIYNAIYREGKSPVSYAKRFAVTSITRDKEYDVTQGTPGSVLLWFTANPDGEAETVRINFVPKPKLKKSSEEYDFSKLLIKGRASRGNLVSKNAIRKITLKSKGVSTIGGKDLWFDEDINRLNEDGRGKYLGQFNSGDQILAIFRDGTYYTTSFDLSNRYQGDILSIEKFVQDKTFSAIYYDGAQKCFYVKRFLFESRDNTPQTFISDTKGSYLVALSGDMHPQMEVTFGGKHAHREAEKIDVEEFIGKKGLQAKGKKVSQYEVASAGFIEPLVKDVPSPETAEEAPVQATAEEAPVQAGQESAGQDAASGLDSTSQNPTSQDSTGQNSTGHDFTSQDSGDKGGKEPEEDIQFTLF